MAAPTWRRDRGGDTAWIWIACLTLALVLGLRVAEIWNVRFTTFDDVWEGWIRAIHAMHENAQILANGTGRFYFLLYIPLGALANGMRSDLAYNLVNAGSFVLGPLMIGLALRRYVGLAPVLLALLLHAALFAQIPTLPPLAFPLVKYYPLIVAGLAIFALQAWLDHGGALRPVLFVLLFLLAIVQYESVAITGIVFVALALAAERATGLISAGDRRWRTAVALFLLLLLLYAVAYLAFRGAHPSDYPGTMVAPFAPKKIAQVLLLFGVGGAAPFNLFERTRLWLQDPLLGPGTTWFDLLPLPWSSLWRDLGFADCAVALAAAFGVGACLWRTPHARASMFWLVLLAAIALFVGANFLHALTPQYQAWIGVGQGWIGSRFSLIALAVAAALVLVSTRAVLGPAPALLLVALASLTVGACALVANSNNRHVTEQVRLRTARFDAVRLAHACAASRAWLDNRTVLAPAVELAITTGNDMPTNFWPHWIERRHGTHVTLISNRNDASDVDTQFDWRTDATGRVRAVVLADGEAAIAPVRVVLAPGARGFVSWRDEAWAAHAMHVELDAARAGCKDGAAMVELPARARPDTVTFDLVPHLDRLAPSAQSAAARVISFDTRAAVDPRGEGWAPREANGAWTVANVATATLDLPQPGTDGLLLELRGFVYRNAVPLRFSLRLNGTELGSAQFTPSAQRHRFRIPPELVREAGAATLEIRVDELRRPADDGLGDPRSLGVFVQSVLLRPVDARPPTQ